MNLGRKEWSERQMSARGIVNKSTPDTPAGRLAPFGPPPLLQGEDKAAYGTLLARISSTVRPADILEEIWVRDIVDLSWDILRLRRLKVNLIAATAYEGLQIVL